MTDFPSDFEREARRHERAVDEHRRRQELEAEVERLRAELGRAEVRAEQFGQCLVAFVRKLTNRNWDGVYVCLPEVTRGGLMTSECRRCDSQEEALDVLAEHFGFDIRLN